MTEIPYEQYTTMICLDLSFVGRKIDKFIQEFGHIMFCEAPFDGSQHFKGSLIKFDVQDFLFFHYSIRCSLNEDRDKINLDQLFLDCLLVY